LRQDEDRAKEARDCYGACEGNLKPGLKLAANFVSTRRRDSRKLCDGGLPESELQSSHDARQRSTSLEKSASLEKG
jgi:hypothetical protein